MLRYYNQGNISRIHTQLDPTDMKLKKNKEIILLHVLKVTLIVTKEALIKEKKIIGYTK